MKKFNSFLVLVFALLTTQWVSAQCTGTISNSGSGATFIFTSTNPTSPNQMHSWDFGDGTYGIGQTSTHTYAASGTYSVIAYFGDSINMCSDTDSLSINAVVTGGTTCSAAFTTTGTSPSFTFTPTGTPTAPPGHYSYDWSFGDGSVATGNNNPTHTYTANSTYNVTCILYDSSWCSDTVTNTVVVTGVGTPTCDASFTYTNQGNTYSFVPNIPNSMAGYSWSFGDGNTSTSNAPSHMYSQNGTYTVSCSLNDPSGCFNVYDTLVFITSNLANGFISGIINKGTTYADNGVVFLIENDSNGLLSLIDTTIIDSSGLYYFSNVAYGTYLVKAALSPNSSDFLNYLPSYYTNIPLSTTGTLLWNNATDVVLNVPYLNNIDIDLVAGTNGGGSGFIGGLVSQGANKTGDPISDINIMVLDQAGNPVSYTYSDHTGSFQIRSLANGTYTVFPEVQGKVTTPIDVIISDNNIGTNDLRIVVNSTTVEASIVTGINNLIKLDAKVYPNPVNDVLNIEFDTSVSGENRVTVMDITGKVITNVTVGATNLMQVNTSGLEEGVYLLTIESNGQKSTYKVVK
ncbi:MAG: PKD repeat protein [Salibacteraceae bacterium]|jgi:PKD repeat protein